MRAFLIRDRELIRRLDARVEQERERHPGRPVSREAVARELIWAALEEKPASKEPCG
jgi:hypothetical protein